jgi:hypothetical protein
LWIAGVLFLAATMYQLHNQGRIWWCACSRFSLWEGDIWSSHCSQHLLDPYSFTHVLHGIVFCWVVSLVFPQVTLAWRFWIVTCIEALWEVIENTQFVIHRYREVTIGIGYEGDSIINSMGDIWCCALGFLLAQYLGFRRSLIFFVVVEILLLIFIRDNLTLNVLMLLYPIDAIKIWQMRCSGF